LRIASLGSGSKGNATLIESGETTLLIDLGFSTREATSRLRRLGKQPEDISAILVTHEHADHIHGVATFARKYKTPVYLTPGTLAAKKLGELPDLREVNCHKDFNINDVHVEPVAVPHDAREPCQYVITAEKMRVGVLTDLGHISPHVAERYQSCDTLLLECNHDVGMLAEGPYPWPLKRRVGGDHGHLNNQQAGELLALMDLDRLKYLMITHISEQNNTTQLAGEALSEVLSGWDGQLGFASQNSGFDWVGLGENGPVVDLFA